MRHLSRLGRMILISLIFILLSVWGVVIWGLQSLHQTAIRNQIQESSNISRVLQEQTTRVLAIVDRVTLRANESTLSAAKTVTALQQVDTVRLANETGLFPDILSQLSVVDAQGRFLSSNLDPTGEKSGHVDLSDREHIRVHLHPELVPEAFQRVNANGLFIGKPVLGKVSKLWTIQVSRKLYNASGEIAGVLVASVNPVYFEQVYKDVQLGAEGMITLIGDDDIVRAQVVGAQPQGMGKTLDMAMRDPQEAKTAQQISFTRVTEGGHQDIVVSRRIPAYPLRLQVSTTTDWALSNWHETLNITLVLTGLMSLGAVVAALLFIRVVRKIENQSDEIRAQHQMQEITIDAMQDGVLLLDRDGRLIKANPMALELLGSRKDEVEGVHISLVLPGEQNQASMADWFVFNQEQQMRYLLRRIQSAAGVAPAIPIPLLSVDLQGQLIWATTSACELFGLDPEAPGRDVFAPETVSQLQLAAMAKPGPLGQGQIVEISWRAGELLPLRLPTLHVPMPPPAQQAVFWIVPSADALSAYAIRTLRNTEWRILSAEDASITPVLLSASPLLDPFSRLTGAVLSMKDVRDVKQKEEENLRMVKKMEQSQKLDALGQLAAGVAHDFNNLLGMIQSHAELVEMKVGPDSPAKKNLQAILQAITRAHNIVLTLNSLGRDAKNEQSDDASLHQFELSALLQETQSLLQASLKGIDVELSPLGTLPGQIMLKGESGALQQVLVNLCVNASHAIGEQRKGRITLQTSCTTDGFVNLDVVDNGSGIPPDILPRIFEPFFTTKGVGKGTGLGLAMVHSIITKMGGSIECHSEMGVGTRFCISLPCVLR